MVDHIIQVDLDATLMCRPDKGTKSFHGTVRVIYPGIIGHIVAVIRHCRMYGRKPHSSSSQLVNIIQLVCKPLKITPSVSVLIGNE